MSAPLPDPQDLVDIAEGASALPEPVFDTRVFQELLESLTGDLDVVVSIYRTFLGTAAILIGSLPEQDCAMQADTLHTLRGSAWMVGAERIARLAAHLQHVAASAVHHPVIKTRIDELTGELDLFRKAINAHARSCHYRSEI